MAKRISRRVREEAAMIAALGASSSTMSVCGYGYHHAWLNPSSGASRLASSAYLAVSNLHVDWRAAWAEAEVLLRTGWTP